MPGFERLTLVYSGTTLGTYLHGFTTSYGRATPVNIRHNFWDTTVLLDGSYPALVWNHEFTLYTENGSVAGFAKDFIGLSDKIVGTAQDLRISYANSPALTLLQFGNCYLDDAPSVQQPELLLLQSAGFIKVKFLGNTKPS